MIRQFGFTWTAISWLLMGYGLFFALSPLQAQTAIKKFSLELKNESLPEALKQLEKAGGKNILFTYNGTESYRVTVSIREKTEREAIDLVLAGKPFLCIEREEYFVVQRKKSDKAIATEGKVYDEKGAPLPFVNILALAADSSFLAGSVTEEDGSFHLPPGSGRRLSAESDLHRISPANHPLPATKHHPPATRHRVTERSSRHRLPPADRTERRNAEGQYSRNTPFTDGIGQRNDLPPPFCHRLGRRIYRTGQRHS
ncbi:carboxypeptidase-like regulatory domain-containing protein [Bacteroides thetaiotaomicron]|nr:carboxypeptidase-like regulatory domain-containing protein [Bacteroides thetaiotaomicron]UVQ70564.1 carboxypeptidase-like regulatory domain-containing protein [Bacteroides thetaiotaomicron]